MMEKEYPSLYIIPYIFYAKLNGDIFLKYIRSIYFIACWAMLTIEVR